MHSPKTANKFNCYPPEHGASSRIIEEMWLLHIYIYIKEPFLTNIISKEIKWVLNTAIANNITYKMLGSVRTAT